MRFQTIILLALVELCLASNHYCSPSSFQVTVHLDEKLHNSLTFIPRLRDHEDHLPFNKTSCRWSVMISTERGDEQCALMQGLPSEMDGSLQNATVAMVKLADRLGHEDVIEAGSVHVLRDIRMRQPFIITVSWPADAPVVNRLAPKVRISLPTPGLSGREFLSYRNRGFVSSAVSQNVTDAMSSIREEAQLASFSSLTEITEFIHANDATMDRFPYKQPLNLSQPHRIGMFLNQSDSTLLYMHTSDSGTCGLSPAVSSNGFTRVGGPCACLRVTNSGRAVVEFDDCSRPMLSLLSFPETVSSSVRKSAHCSELTRQVLLLIQTRAPSSTLPNAVDAAMTTQHTIELASAQLGVIVGSSVAAFVAILLIVITLVILVVRRRRYGSYSIQSALQER